MTEMVFRNIPEQIMMSAIVGTVISFALMSVRTDIIVTVLLGIVSFIAVYGLIEFMGWGKNTVPYNPEQSEEVKQ